MVLLERHSSVPVSSSSDDVNTSTSSEEYYSLDDEQNSDVFPDNSPSCSPDVFDSHKQQPATVAAEISYIQQQQQQPANTLGGGGGGVLYDPTIQVRPNSTLGSNSQITVQQRIIRTRPIWHLPLLGRAGAVTILHSRLSGVFVVRQSSKSGCLALSVRVGDRPNIEHYIIEPASRGLRLENSFHYFKELALLITYYAQNLDELPVKLQLPLVLAEADNYHKLNSYSLMGQDFWSSIFSEISLPCNKADIPSLEQQRRCSLPVQPSLPVQQQQQQQQILLHSTTRTQSDTQWQSKKSHHQGRGLMKSQTQPLFNQRRPNVLQLQQSEPTSQNTSSETRRLSLTNHSDASLFTQIPKDSNSVNTLVSSRHDYVNITDMDTSGATTNRLFRPISEQSLCDNNMDQSISSPVASNVTSSQPLVSTVSVDIHTSANNNVHSSEKVVHTSKLTIPCSQNNDVHTTDHSSHDISTDSVQDIVKDIEREIESLANMQNDFEPNRTCSEADDFQLGASATSPTSNNTTVVSSNHSYSQQNAITSSMSNAHVGMSHLHTTTTTSVNHKHHHTATKHLSLMPVYKSNEPVVFTFDFTTLSPENRQQQETNAMQGLQVPETIGPETSPLSAKTQYSSPAYTEPFDSLIGKVAGVTQTKNAINVSNFLRQKLVVEKKKEAKCDFTKHEQQQKQSVCSHNETKNETTNSTSVHYESSYINNQCDNNIKVKSSPINNTAVVHTKAKTMMLDPSERGRVCKSDTYITGALDSSLTCNPQYKVSLEEIPLSSPHITLMSPSASYYKHCAERSFSLRSLERNSLDRTRMKQQGLRAQSLPRDGPEPHHKPPLGHHSTSHRDQSLGVGNKLARTDSFRGPKLSNSFEENFFAGRGTGGNEMQHQPTIYRQFPLNINKTSSRRSLCSDKSTLEDILSNMSPELTLEPIKPLTEKNVNRISEYDNVCSGFCNHVTRRQGGAGSSRRTMVTSSVGTHYSQPWDSNLLQTLLKQQQSSQNPAVIPVDPDYGSVYPDSDVLSQIGSDIACSTFEWRKKPDRDSATETTPQPALFEDAIQPVIYEGNEIRYRSTYQPPMYEDNAVQTGVEATMSDDEGVSVEEVLMDSPLDLHLPHPRFLLNDKLGSETPGGKVENYVSDLAVKAETMFGSHVDKFVKCTLEGFETNPHTVLRNVRQFMNGIKNYLVQSGERQLNELIELERNRLGQDEFLNVDSIIESSLHKCVVKPLKTHIYKLFVAYYRNIGQLEELSESIKYARTKTPQELGIRINIQPPCGSSMEVIKEYITAMQNASSPLSKLENLLGATSTMVNSVQSRDRGSVSSQDTNTSLATDDLLPMLIYVLVQCGAVTAEIEADYMWGLLHPCVLAGEGGYYLTTFSSAVHLLKNLKAAMEATPGEVRFPTLGDLQGFMKIIIPDEKHNSIITKTLPVRPNMTTKDVCSMIAHRFRITNPQDYGLYVLVMGIEDRVSDNSCPQQIKADLQKERRQCVFAYKRNNAKFAWPVHFK